ASLAPGATRTYRCTRTGVRASFRNVATVIARSAAGTRVRASSTVPAVVRVVPPASPQRPRIAIVKAPGRPTVKQGDRPRFTIILRNPGNVALHGVRVADPLAPRCSRTLGALAPGRSASYACRGPRAARDHTNVATATGVSPRGATVRATADASVSVKH